MVYKYNFSKITKALIFSIILLWICIDFYSLSKLFSWFGLVSKSIVFEIVMITLGLVYIILLLLFYFTSYKIEVKSTGKKCLTLKTAFFDSLMSKAEIERIADIILVKQTNNLYLNFCSLNGDISIVKININAKHYEKFINTIKSLNANAVYTIEDNEQ